MSAVPVSIIVSIIVSINGRAFEVSNGFVRISEENNDHMRTLATALHQVAWAFEEEADALDRKGSTP